MKVQALQRGAIILTLSGILVLLVVIANSRLVVSGLQAEAKIMLTYMHSLETAYFTEHGEYVAFEHYYGAPIDGVDNCTQPHGAALLGFVIRWCHRAGPAPVHYAYKSEVETTGEGPKYRGVALSGSDAERQSFVCLGDDETDGWMIDGSGLVVRNVACEPRHQR